MNKINLQRIRDYIFPTDAKSRKNLNYEKFKVHDLDIISPRLVKQGYILKIENY